MAKPKTKRAKAAGRKPKANASIADLPKLSEVAIEFAKPLLDEIPTRPPSIDDIRLVMMMATVAWDLPILQRRTDEDASSLRGVFERLMARVGPDMRRIIDQLMQRRVTGYGHDPRIGIFDVMDDGGGHARVVATIALPETPR
jgi:hypothetical protein